MKRWLMFSILILLLLSVFVSATNETCSGFWGSVSCLLWGDPSLKSNIAGEATGGNLVGMVVQRNLDVLQEYQYCGLSEINCDVNGIKVLRLEK